MRLRLKTIRAKLFVLLLLAAGAPVIVAGLLSQQTARKAMRKAVNDLHSRAALAEAEHAVSYVRSLATELSSAIEYEDPAQLGPALEQEFLTRVFLRRNRISIVALLDGTDVHASVFVDDPVAFAQQEPQFLSHDTVSADETDDFHRRAAALLAHVKRGQPFAVSEPYVTRARHRPAVIVIAPAQPGRRLSLAAELGLDDLSKRLGTTVDGAHAFLLDRSGHVLIDADPLVEQARDDYSSRLRSALQSHAAGVAQFDSGGQTFLAAYAPVASSDLDLGWTAVVERPLEEATAPVRALFRSTGLVLVVALLLVIIAAPIAAGRLASPIAALAEGARLFAQGNLSHRIHLDSDDELGHLARTFNEMGRSVEEANSKLVHFNEELRLQVDQRSRELKLAQQQLLRSQRLAALGDLSAGLAHEVNNPLAAIVGNVQLLLMDAPEKSSERQMLQDVLDQSLRISDIVKDLQALSEAQRGGLTPVDVHSMLARVIEKREPELASDGIALTRNFQPSAARVLGDENALREVFGHLLANSASALKDRRDRNITLATTVIDNEAVVVEVSDTGHGIPKEHLERVFNPFFTTKATGSSRGLALSICHRIVENHGGKISVQSEEGVGTTVTVVLPAAPPQPFLR